MHSISEGKAIVRRRGEPTTGEGSWRADWVTAKVTKYLESLDFRVMDMGRGKIDGGTTREFGFGALMELLM